MNVIVDCNMYCNDFDCMKCEHTLDFVEFTMSVLYFWGVIMIIYYNIIFIVFILNYKIVEMELPKN